MPISRLPHLKTLHPSLRNAGFLPTPRPLGASHPMGGDGGGGRVDTRRHLSALIVLTVITPASLIRTSACTTTKQAAPINFQINRRLPSCIRSRNSNY
ncbi:hypothetical protein CEXT_721221 [Caerostris extrusa]|uniref:Uncharacterized protein n=1 Tax=Caerostris extrusa TaxID=172846 RepID=A0AAV4RA71_CAEEX|nr:hypothetical protein CEXT_721221 [Caerostris extrusa]